MKSNFLLKIFAYPFRLTRKSLKILKLSIKHKLGWLGVPVVIAFRGFTNGKMLFLSGIVSEDKGLQKPAINNNVWQNMVAMIKRYSGDEIPDVTLEVNIDGKKFECTTNEKGYFSLDQNISLLAEEEAPQWLNYTASAEIIDDQVKYELSSDSDIMQPVKENKFGIVSDIDDTIIVSHSTQALKKLRLMLLRNSRSRKPFPGASAFYSALHEGISRQEHNPFFYVSSSEWNLYDLLDDFCTFNGFPKGVFLLQDLKTDMLKFWKSGGGSHEHKLVKIRKILNAYPDMKFVLIGDNGQHDPEIYSRVVEEFPDRILAIYIRYIRKKRADRVNGIVEALKKKGVPMLVVKDSYEAAKHAIEMKLINPASMPDIEAEKEKDV